MPTPSKLSAPKARSLQLFATGWSLRQYPSAKREWSWERKFSVMRAAGFDGIFSPPRPEMEGRGGLTYLAVTSIAKLSQITPIFLQAKALGAVGMDIQLGDFDMPLEKATKLSVRIHEVAREMALPYAIETHRDTFTETPESTLALTRAFRAATDETLPLCLDHSHFAIIRHLSPPTFWERLRKPKELLDAATQFHLRPFNGHHCQIPVLNARGQRTPEYHDWLMYSNALLHHLASQKSKGPVWAVPEIGNAAPAYNLSCFEDTWADVETVIRDLRMQWQKAVQSA